MKTGTVTAAALRLHRTQPQVSRLIGTLEEELGFKVFSRHKRRLTPTQDGRVFYRLYRRS
jgi:DNA-binding transcriptional LysR family regulator